MPEASPSARLGALAPIRERKLAEAARIRCGRGAIWARAEGLAPAPDLAATLRGGTVIAEMKRRSPSGGELSIALDPAVLARSYAGAGAAALSVLTDGPDFGGTLADLAAAAAAVSVPVLRKDFVVDPVQVAEARLAGAGAILLIVALLEERGVLEEHLAAAGRAGISALVEVHDPEEARRALDAGASVIGVNNRDLRTLRTDLSVFARVRVVLPENVVVVAESGVRTPADVRRLRAEGADAVLVGEALMRDAEPATLCAELVQAARE
ncbi:MAG: indole-3-glycerol phosphate synthase TrpC [Candidatus Dormibacteria bacterium]